LAWCASSQNLHFAMFFSGFCFFVVYEDPRLPLQPQKKQEVPVGTDVFTALKR